MEIDITANSGLQSLPPRLRKNKRLQYRWGVKYYAAVRETVFSMRSSPYMPAEPPPGLREEGVDSEPLYVCKQCRDCFRFRSSFEDHNNRRSWILGYWCHNCFVTVCTHTPENNVLCAACITSDIEKKSFLRAKGLKKGQKKGAIKIFHNQCQFFAHLKMHDTHMVDMADVMLMPIPSDVDREHYSDLDKVCEILMEHMFISRIHILDWLRRKHIDGHWWKLIHAETVSKDNPLVNIIKIFKERQRIKHLQLRKIQTPPTITPKLNFNQTSSSSRVESSCPDVEIISVNPRNSTCTFPENKDTVDGGACSSTVGDNTDPLESTGLGEESCPRTDIAFVDCGPTARLCNEPFIVRKSNDFDQGFNKTSIDEGRLTDEPEVEQSVKDEGLAKQGSVETSLSRISSTPSSVNLSGNFVCLPKISVKTFATERPSTRNKSLLWRDFSRHYELQKQLDKETSVNTIVNQPRAVKPSLPLALTNSEQTGIRANSGKANSRILTVHSPKSINISTIISQLPPEVINSKKIVFIGQDPEGGPVHATSVTSTQKVHLKKDLDSKVLKTIPLKVTLPGTVSGIANEQMKNVPMQKMLPEPVSITSSQISLDGKIVYQNGRKYIIRQTQKNNNMIKASDKPTDKLTTNASKFRSIAPKTIPSLALPSAVSSVSKSAVFGSNSQSKPPILTCVPKLVPSNVSTVLEKAAAVLKRAEETVEYFWIEPDSKGRHFLVSSTTTTVQKRNNKFPGAQVIFPKFKQQMLDDLLHLGKPEVERRLKALRYTQNEYKKVIGVHDNFVTRDNMVMIKLLEDAMKISSPWVAGESGHADTLEDIFNQTMRKWELDFNRGKALICSRCTKIIKPKSYIVGLSETAKDEARYCECYNYKCPECGNYQGSVPRFTSHLKFHKRMEPHMCPECYRLFSTHRKLELHTWTTCVHPLIRRWYGCKVCDVEGFLCLEDVTRHFAAMHSEKKVACPKCRMVLNTLKSFKEHVKENHPDSREILDLIWLMVCTVGQCIVQPKHYRLHMDNHIGVAKLLYYKCPFCPLLLKEANRGREEIKTHMFMTHLDRLTEVISPETLSDIMIGKPSERAFDELAPQDAHDVQSFLSSSFIGFDPQNPKSELTTELMESPSVVVPKIVNTRTISPEVFERCSDNSDQATADYLSAMLTKKSFKGGMECSVWSINLDGSSLPSIIDVRSEAPEKLLPKILDVRSIADDKIDEESADSNEGHSETRKWTEMLDVTAISKTISDSEMISSDHQTNRDKLEEEERGSKITDKSSGKSASSEKRSRGSSKVCKISSASESAAESPKSLRSKVQEANSTKLTSKVPRVLRATRSGPAKRRSMAKISTFQGSGEKSSRKGFQNFKDEKEPAVSISEKTNTDHSSKQQIDLSLIKPVTTLKSRITPRKIHSLTSLSSPTPLKTRFHGKTANNALTTAARKRNKLRKNLGKVESSDHDDLLKPDVILRRGSTLKEFKDVIENGCDDRKDLLKTDEVLRIVKNDFRTMSKDIGPPPPLARIPQHLLGEPAISPTTDASIEKQERRESFSSETMLSVRKRRHGEVWRIALNGPTTTRTLPQKFRCHLCGELINTAWNVVRSHFSSKHSWDYQLAIVQPRLLKMSKEFIEGGYREVSGSRKRKSEGSSSPPKRRRRWTPKKHVERTSHTGLGLFVKQESVQDGEGNFKCKKCDLKCENMTDLRQHIASSHRIKERYLICLECGENFVVAPSLQMHLKAFHGIEDPNSYLIKNTAYAPDVIDESEAKTTVSNQCHVCKAVFEDKAAVDKHLRVHGMAFLNRKRIEARNALRCSEKKPRLEGTEDAETETKDGDSQISSALQEDEQSSKQSEELADTSKK
ncbi:uncharacterized protein LOC105703005 isoform X2 [Orussus abietinus]|nr:uncharacterized protein LOC105703005 isoform X2 [Orussus abietinus]XP_023290457.1 uncharacterized protein LOC105703005 isoform X2 [Orussus abietinus]XP_023290461.1 uncharacterized protein LOC105703005 isoform X2 [Orussus abietinus]XP_023290462.1 uncharacterized protein LOC105703005 isoform X2 [Orussus abietinus]